MNDDGRTDAELVAGTARGDDVAFGVLVRRYIRAATLLAVQLVRDCDEAEDVVQDAFGVVYKKAHTFDAARPFAPWFFAIVRRLGSNRRARDVRRARLLRLWRRGTASEPVSSLNDDVLLARVDTEAARRAMENLSPMQRACFELVAIRDLAIEEVAAMHGISESTVRQHVFRARATLRNMLDGTQREQEEA